MNPKYTFEELYPTMCRIKGEIEKKFNSKDYPDRTARNVAMLGAIKAFKSICSNWSLITWIELEASNE